MPRRPDDVRMISCACDALEADVVDEMKRVCGLTTDANLVRTALWNFIDHLGLDAPNEAFDLRWRNQTRPRKTTTSPPVTTPRAAVRHGRKQAENHPWGFAANSKEPSCR